MNDGQVMIITGTSKGIGKYLAGYYARRGFRVIGCSRKKVDYELKNYTHFCLDVSDETRVRQMCSEIYKDYGHIDILINNAGIASMSYVLLTPVKVAHDIISTNFIGTFLFCREAVKIMQKNHYGRIVNISSIAVPLGQIGTSVYSASKAAVEQFTKVMAREVISYNIRANTLGLSFVKDSGIAENISDRAIEKTLEHTTLKSWLNFEDVARAIDFFIAKENDKITGQTLYLGGV